MMNIEVELLIQVTLSILRLLVSIKRQAVWKEHLHY